MSPNVIDRLKPIGQWLSGPLATDEAVADTNDSFNAIAALVELLSEAPDVYVQRARIAVIAITPDVVEQLLVCSYLRL